MSDDTASCGCLPWGRRRGGRPRTSASTNRRSTSASKFPASTSSAKVFSISTTPEAPPTKWRSQAGASDSSSTGSVHGGAGEKGNRSVHISATAFGACEGAPPVLVAGGARTRSTVSTSEVCFSSQPPHTHGRANGSVSSTGNPPASGDGGASPLLKADVTLADSDDPAAAALRLQGLQQRYRQRAVEDTAAGGGGGGAPLALDDRFRSDQMQCDSFTYSVTAQGRRSSAGTGPPQLRPLPPLPTSPGRAGLQAAPHGGYGRASGNGNGNGRASLQATTSHGGNGHGHGHGPIHGVSFAQRRDQAAAAAAAAAAATADKRLMKKAPPPPPTDPSDLPRGTSITTTHIPGSLPSMTGQGQVSPGIVRVHPPAAAASWDKEPPPAPAAAAAATSPTSPLSASPRQAALSWSGVEASPSGAPPPARSSNPAVVRGGRVQFRQAEQGLQTGDAAGVSGGGGGSGMEGFSFSSNQGQPLSRLAATAAATRAAAGAPALLRQSNNGGGVAHRTTHGPVGYSSAAAAATAALYPTGPGGGFRGGDPGTSVVGAVAAAAAAREAKPREGGGDYLPSHHSNERPMPVLEGQLGGGGGGGNDRQRGGGGGRLSLPFYDSVAPGAVLAKPPSFRAPLQQHTSPGCMAAGPQGPELQLVDPPQRPRPQPPQHTPSQRLQAAPAAEDPRVTEPKPAPIEPSTAPKALAVGPASAASFGVAGGGGAGGDGGGGGGGGGGTGEPPTSHPRPAARPSQQRMQAAWANEEMLRALLGDSKRAIDISALKVDDGGTAAELERFDRVQDAMSRLDDILAAPSRPAVARSLDTRVSKLGDAAYDFPGSSAPGVPNPALGVKRW